MRAGPAVQWERGAGVRKGRDRGPRPAPCRESQGDVKLWQRPGPAGKNGSGKGKERKREKEKEKQRGREREKKGKGSAAKGRAEQGRSRDGVSLSPRPGRQGAAVGAGKGGEAQGLPQPVRKRLREGNAGVSQCPRWRSGERVSRLR